MGYSHYFPQNRSFTKPEWDKVKFGVNKILEYSQNLNRSDIALQESYERNRFPIVNNIRVQFNGPDGFNCEDFFITKKVREHRPYEDKREPVFNFCKTNREPYDLIVCSCLLWIEHVAPRVLHIHSDGAWNKEWLEPRLVFRQLFNIEPPTLNLKRKY